jgi:hypothetical protein
MVAEDVIRMKNDLFQTFDRASFESYGWLLSIKCLSLTTLQNSSRVLASPTLEAFNEF